MSSTNSFTQSVYSYLETFLLKEKHEASPTDLLRAFTSTIRDSLASKWLHSRKKFDEKKSRHVYYLSLEFLLGRMLRDALTNLGLLDEGRKTAAEFGFDLESIIESEIDMALGNGGLGRLAACFMESLSTLGYPATGYSIRYEHGIFKQDIANGYQKEMPDDWLEYGNYWETERKDLRRTVRFYGIVAGNADGTGEKWLATKDVIAVPFDIFIPGYRSDVVSNLRLWKAKTSDGFSLSHFNRGEYSLAEGDRAEAEALSKILYPDDSSYHGKVLRFKQQYFFAAATLSDILQRHKSLYKIVNNLHEKAVIHLNDTHPAIAIPEMMRILNDEEKLSWDEAWHITQNLFAYTNHTIVPEALEQWSSQLVNEILPRHFEIISEIDAKEKLKLRDSFSSEIISENSIVDNGNIRMSSLAITGSRKVNGVSKLHTGILTKKIFKAQNVIYPDKFISITNGVTQRRFLLEANPELSELITSRIGDGWIIHPEQLCRLEEHLNDGNFLLRWDEIKQNNKIRLTDFLQSSGYGLVNPLSVFDVQIKRFHEYKRQLLKILHTISLYLHIKKNGSGNIVPRTVIFAGKAAPSYFMVKLYIKLINSVAEVISKDEAVNKKLKLVFIKNYGLTLAEKIIPAADISEQISTAGYEASGTGNMKFALNGAITAGTPDGANIEIGEHTGADNFYLFGLTNSEAESIRQNGYNPSEYYKENTELKEVIDLITSDHFNKKEPGIFSPITEDLLRKDFYLVLADFKAYCKMQKKIETDYTDRKSWTIKSILNTARSGYFSSDRTIREYAELVWGIQE